MTADGDKPGTGTAVIDSTCGLRSMFFNIWIQNGDFRECLPCRLELWILAKMVHLKDLKRSGLPYRLNL